MALSSFAKSVDRGLKAVKKATGTAVTYHRGGSSVNLTAVPAESRFEAGGAGGLKTEVQVRDYLIVASDLVLDGQRTDPEPGDVIEEDFDQSTLRFQVMAPSGQAQAWRTMDRARLWIRIHTKRIGTA